MKTIIEMAHKVGLLDGTLPVPQTVERFATLHRAEIIAELTAGVEMPEEAGSAQVFSGQNAHGLPEYSYVDAYTADQMRDYAAAAVAKTNAAWQVVNQVREEVTDELRAELAQRDAHIVEYNTSIQAELLKLLTEKDALTAELLRKDAETALQGISDFGQMQKLLAERDALKAENERLLADASRYQWLTTGKRGTRVRNHVLENAHEHQTIAAAIDAALKGQP